jgi:hypothetical protein
LKNASSVELLRHLNWLNWNLEAFFINLQGASSMKKFLIAFAGVLLGSTQAMAGPTYHLLTESDPGGANNLVLSHYDGLSDLLNLNTAGSNAFIPSLPGAVSAAGMAFDGSQYLLLTESDPGGANNLVLTRYNSLTDLYSLNAAASNAFIPSLPGAVSAAGLDYDGNQYLLLTESDPGGANNLVLTRYNSLNDLLNLDAADSNAFIPSLPGAVSAAGLMSIPGIVSTSVPEPSSLALFGLGFSGLAFARRKAPQRL